MSGKSVSQSALKALCDRAQRDIEVGLEWGGVEGCSLAVAYSGEILHAEGFGAARVDTPMQIMSPTKTILDSALWILMQRGLIRPEDYVGDHVPEFATNGKQGITLEMLQTHTAGLAWQPIDFPDWGDRAYRLQKFADWTPAREPGIAYEYHPATASWVLAEVIERVSGVDYRKFLRREVLEPLGMGDVHTLSLGEPVDAQADSLLASNYMQGYAPDPALRPPMPGGFGTVEGLAIGMPGAGAVGTSAGLALLYQEFLHNRSGLWDAGVLVNAREVIRLQKPDNFGRPILRTLSFLLAGDAKERYGERVFFGQQVSARAFGHQGMGGQIAWADPESGLSFAYLTNSIVFPPGGCDHPRARELSALACAALAA
ncbi:beta-lactamase family protein [Hoeflea sp. WL0058]|uniref:Beta-lactamase family protein n=1 Tax=Flavimaribacter sediminis TaxID=2865987 RepID=A0AAE3D215_9HYPH|nr:serine hydrolase domain-containing protein [Flavimaribacter sediminis]MBW8638466.1 beta-lactamase family protein [Flavimaribacter sediminis]